MFTLATIKTELEYDSLLSLEKDMRNILCNACSQGKTLTEMLASGCGEQYTILCCGEEISTYNLNECYKEECEAHSYGY